MFDTKNDADCWRSPSAHLKTTKFTTQILYYFTTSERRMTLKSGRECVRNNTQGFLLCCKGSIDFCFYRNTFGNVLSVLKLLSKSYRISCSLSWLLYFAT